MTELEFRSLCEKKIVILDGATGTNLQRAGMPVGVCPEKWILEHKDTVKKLQKEFLAAGTDILYAPTFTANRLKLKEYGLEDRLVEFNTELVRLSKEAVAEYEAEVQLERVKPHFIAGDLTMTGKLVYPLGEILFEDLVEIYKEQVRALLAAGVDLFVAETMMSLQECRAAVLAVKESCDLPIMVTLTFAEDNKTMYGTTPQAAVTVLQSLGASAVGVNCSAGPETVQEVVAGMAAVAEVPVIAKPNAGLPGLKDGVTVYDMPPEKFAEQMGYLVAAGAGIVGGCCGSEPAHIAALAVCLENREVKAAWKQSEERSAMLSTEYRAFPIDLSARTKIIGERINPTGKKALQAELREGCLDLVLQYAKEQEEAGAFLLDVNAGMPGIDEKQTMLRITYELMQHSGIPLAFDSAHAEVLEAALRIYPGRALVNSVTCEKEKMEALLPIVKKYGAMFILLPLSENGLPKDGQEKIAMIHTVMDAAAKCGLSKKDVVVDGLVNTIGANREAARETLATIRYCREELQVATSIGLSNISFGLPARSYVNAAFLTMAIEAGLTMAIANPCQKMPMDALLAADLLMGKESADIAYIEASPTLNEGMTQRICTQDVAKQTEQTGSTVYEAVLKGNKRTILTLVEEELQREGKTAGQILNAELIPAINEVGKLFEQKRYFLPQLIASAETMELAIKRLRPFLEAGVGKTRETVVIATVKGDIHDIGKNLVTLMMKNYGFLVIDLGKDVPSEKIIACARETNAEWIALSALMTTTMTRMKEVIELKNAAGLQAKVLIGGAVTTKEYAEEIGADAYAKDAQEAVRILLEMSRK